MNKESFTMSTPSTITSAAASQPPPSSQTATNGIQTPCVFKDPFESLDAARNRRDKLKKELDNFDNRLRQREDRLAKRKYFIAGREILAEAEQDDTLKATLNSLLDRRLRYAGDRRLFKLPPLQTPSSNSAKKKVVPNIAFNPGDDR